MLGSFASAAASRSLSPARPHHIGWPLGQEEKSPSKAFHSTAFVQSMKEGNGEWDNIPSVVRTT